MFAQKNYYNPIYSNFNVFIIRNIRKVSRTPIMHLSYIIQPYSGYIQQKKKKKKVQKSKQIY